MSSPNNNGHRVLTSAEVQAIIKACQTGLKVNHLERGLMGLTQSEIAKRHNVTGSVIGRVWQRFRVKGNAGAFPLRGPMPRPIPEAQHDPHSLYCAHCHTSKRITSDPIYGATMESCKCGSKVISPGWAA